MLPKFDRFLALPHALPKQERAECPFAGRRNNTLINCANATARRPRNNVGESWMNLLRRPVITASTPLPCCAANGAPKPPWLVILRGLGFPACAKTKLRLFGHSIMPGAIEATQNRHAVLLPQYRTPITIGQEGSGLSPHPCYATMLRN